MASATVTSKGQVTIPVDVRTHLGLSTGTGSSSCSMNKRDDMKWSLPPAR